MRVDSTILPGCSTQEDIQVGVFLRPDRGTIGGMRAEIEAIRKEIALRRARLDQRLGEAGTYPFTRGIHPDMYRGRKWTMRQYAGYASAKETNERFHYLIEHGSTGLSMAFDLPTQLGLDSDDPRCLGEVGRTGVAIDTIDDMRTAFDGIPLDQVSTSMTINAPAAVMLAFYVVAAERQGVPPEQLAGTIHNVDSFRDPMINTSTPIALGERLFSRWDFKSILASGAVDIIQPDPSHSGGITETRKIATMAEAYDVAVALHCPLGPIALASCLQIDGCTYNAFIQEQSLGIHYNIDNDLLDYLTDPSVFDYAEGFVAIPSGPGLGIDVNEEYVIERAQQGHRWRNPIWRHEDGSIAEW